jgi:hypothetical protein
MQAAGTREARAGRAADLHARVKLWQYTQVSQQQRGPLVQHCGGAVDSVDLSRCMHPVYP